MEQTSNPDPVARQRLSGDQIRRLLRDRLIGRSSKLAIKHLGCSLDELKRHLESQFERGMSWSNYGTHGWQIDHVVPLASSNDYHKRLELHHYRNLKPLWAKQNQIKGSRTQWHPTEDTGFAVAQARETLRVNIGEGQPFSASEAKCLGCSSALLSYHEKKGNIRRLGRGVFAFPDDELDMFYSISFLQQSLPDLHIGAESALGYHATKNARSFAEPLVLCTQRRKELPDWFTRIFSVICVRRTPFESDDPHYREAIYTPPNSVAKISISSLELAFVEILNEIGIRLTLSAARDHLAKAENISVDKLVRLLKATHRVKVRKLCLQLSKELRLPFADDLGSKLRPLQTCARWTRKCRDGSRLDLK
jgi:hypothetical protein